MKPFCNFLLAYDVIGQSALGSRGVRDVVAGLDSDPRFRWRATKVPGEVSRSLRKLLVSGVYLLTYLTCLNARCKLPPYVSNLPTVRYVIVD